MSTAQADITAIAEWLATSSRMRRTPLGMDNVLIGPYATLLPIDPDATDYPDLSGLAENGLALFVPTQQMPSILPKSRLDMEPHGHPPLVERIRHMFSHRLGVELPDVLTLALTAPDQSINDALIDEGLSDIDLNAVAVLAVPLWAIPGPDRALTTKLCRYP